MYHGVNYPLSKKKKIYKMDAVTLDLLEVFLCKQPEFDSPLRSISEHVTRVYAVWMIQLHK